MEVEKAATSRLVGGARREGWRRWRWRDGWSHTHVWRIKIRRLPRLGRSFLRTEGTRPTPGAPLRVPVPGREVPITSGWKNQRELRLREAEAAGAPGSSLKGPRTDLSDSLPLSLEGRQLEGHQRHTGKN
uniref:Uncharacterized protein n=1 Tax=Molossus molossus TaxID=27622 RepID=A0A7J8BKU3_MOLMO|nr:hypothetical protein HJG59_010190 [Molossus molossus]